MAKFLFLLLFSIPAFGYVPFPITSGSSLQRVEWALINNGGSCSTGSTSGPITANSHAGTGECGMAITSGTFSATPFCTCTSVGTNAGESCQIVSGASSTSFQTYVSVSGGPVDNNFYVICFGPR